VIKAAFFDLDDTLCDDSAAWVHCAGRAATLAAQRIPGLDVAKLSDRFLRISESFWMGLDYANETRPLHELRTSQFAEALGQVGVSDRPDIADEMATLYAAIRSTEISLFPDALTTLDVLRGYGVALACITNGLASTHIEKAARLGLYEAFDHVVIAGEYGHYKPDPRIFRRALELCECKPADAIMVGDDLTNDIGGAHSAGIRAYWFNPKRRVRSLETANPDAEIRSLSEILQRSDLLV